MSKRFVYVLKNHDAPPRYYTGLTSDVARRHAEHNTGSCRHTAMPISCLDRPPRVFSLIRLLKPIARVARARLPCYRASLA